MRHSWPGLLESVYEAALAYELAERGVAVRRQVGIPVAYKGVRLEEGFRADIVAGDKVVVELKAVEKIAEVHKKQVQTYLRLTGCRLGYLLNFNEALLKNGILRVVNGLDD